MTKAKVVNNKKAPAKKRTSKKAAGLAVISDDNVPAMLEQVRAKIKELKGDDNESHQTTGELEGFGNIFEITKPSDLIKAYSSVKGRAAAYDVAAKEMGIKAPPAFKIGNAGADKWFADLKKCYKMATHKAELDKLAKVETELKSMLSEEDKRKASMQTIADLLSSTSHE